MTQTINKRLNEIVNKKLRELDDIYDQEEDDDRKLLKLKTCKHPGCRNQFPVNYKNRNRQFCRAHTKNKEKDRLIKKQTLVKKLISNRKVIQDIIINNTLKERYMDEPKVNEIKEEIKAHDIEVKPKRKRDKTNKERGRSKRAVFIKKNEINKTSDQIEIESVFVGCKGVDDYCAKYDVNYFIGNILRNTICLENDGEDGIYYLDEIIHYAQKEKERRTRK